MSSKNKVILIKNKIIYKTEAVNVLLGTVNDNAVFDWLEKPEALVKLPESQKNYDEVVFETIFNSEGSFETLLKEKTKIEIGVLASIISDKISNFNKKELNLTHLFQMFLIRSKLSNKSLICEDDIDITYCRLMFVEEDKNDRVQIIIGGLKKINSYLINTLIHFFNFSEIEIVNQIPNNLELTCNWKYR